MTEQVKTAGQVSDAEVSVSLAILANAARAGASREGVAALAAKLRGEQMITLHEVGGGDVQILVNRVRSVGPRFGGGTVLAFTGLESWEPKGLLEVDDEMHKVVRSLKEHGWNLG